MSIDLTPLYTQVATCSTLNQSMTTMFDGLLAQLDAKVDPVELATALRALVVHPDDENRQIAMVDLLREALTRNTSHCLVRPNDPLKALVESALEMKPRAKAARVASILLAVKQPALDQVELTLTAHVDALTEVVTTIEAKTDKMIALQAGLEAEVADLDRVTTLVKAKTDLEAQLATKTAEHAAEVAAHAETKAELAQSTVLS